MAAEYSQEVLTDEEMRRFKRDGWLLKRGILDPALCAACRELMWSKNEVLIIPTQTSTCVSPLISRPLHERNDSRMTSLLSPPSPSFSLALQVPRIVREDPASHIGRFAKEEENPDAGNLRQGFNWRRCFLPTSVSVSISVCGGVPIFVCLAG